MSQPQLNLQFSSTTAYLPATVGFYLTGVDIRPLKMWYFGNKVIGPVHNLVYNYDDFSEGSHDVHVDIGFIGPDGKFSKTGSSNIVTINVFPRKPQFNVSQTEAVIYKTSYVGISLSTTLTGDKEKYESGDGQKTEWRKDLRYWFQYKKANPSPYTGKVFISGYETVGPNVGVKYLGEQEFSVLVYSNDISGSIEIQPKYDNDPSIPQGAYKTKRELTFLANLGQLSGSKVINASWDFGDGKSKPGLQVLHRYDAPKNYPVKCTVKLLVENSSSILTLYKTVIIMDPTP